MSTANVSKMKPEEYFVFKLMAKYKSKSLGNEKLFTILKLFDKLSQKNHIYGILNQHYL